MFRNRYITSLFDYICLNCIVGQMIWLNDAKHILFLGSPHVSSFDDMTKRHVYLSDIPLYDATRELILMRNQRLAEISIRYIDDFYGPRHKFVARLRCLGINENLCRRNISDGKCDLCQQGEDTLVHFIYVHVP